MSKSSFRSLLSIEMTFRYVDPNRTSAPEPSGPLPELRNPLRNRKSGFRHIPGIGPQTPDQPHKRPLVLNHKTSHPQPPTTCHDCPTIDRHGTVGVMDPARSAARMNTCARSIHDLLECAQERASRMHAPARANLGSPTCTHAHARANRHARAQRMHALRNENKIVLSL